MCKQDDIDTFIPDLMEWFQKNARDLPWRKTTDPYCIWISEIMLQQTRVEAVKGYYRRFLEALPTILDLAQAEEDLLLKLWQGLGYYNRVRNMQTAAKTIVETYNGIFPNTYKEIRSLKGIGDYTAGAVASIAFGLPNAAVDGNVLRVMSRLFADAQDIAAAKTKVYWKEILEEMMPKDQPGQFNQALMELGACICLPNGDPLCHKCPVRPYCMAYQKNAIDFYPVKSQKNARKMQQLSVFFLVNDRNEIALHKRGEKGLLAGLWELPNIPADISAPAVFSQWGIHQADISILPLHKHIFTHIEWHMEPYFVRVKEFGETPFIWVTPLQAEKKYALPSAFQKIWNDGISQLNN